MTDETKPGSKPAAGPTAKGGAKGEARSGAKAGAKSGAKPPAKAGAKPASTSGAKPAAKPASKPGAKPASKPAAKPAAKSVAKPPAGGAAAGEPGARGTAPQMAGSDRDRLLAGRHSGPHGVLGAHPGAVGGTPGVVVRARQPDAVRAEVVIPGREPVAMDNDGHSFFSVFLPGARVPLAYRLRFWFADGNCWERDDPYRFMPTLGDVDLHLFNEGTHRRLWEKLGAHHRTHEGVEGTAFAVWAPNAQRVSVIGDFCGWDGRVYPMRIMGSSGVWEIFIPEIRPGALYKFEILTREGMLREKIDPFAFKMQQAPGTAAIVEPEGSYGWKDGAWMAQRARKDWPHEPMHVYEVHLGSWMRCPEEGNRPLSYREIAPKLAAHVKRLGFTHVEMLPVMEHPFYGSWGYQVSGYYAPTSRYGSPDDFRFLVDTLHEYGIGVLLDWVPAHFPKDDYALRRFDGTALFEHEDPRLGEHPDWGTLIFNYGRNEVRNFLVANALYWLHEFHIDGLRVDAVASMLYLDYSREPGQWLRNRLGGRENLDAIDFLRQFNEAIREDAPGCVTVAEESTAWPGVTTPVRDGGLGFTFKWNMGWMHDTLLYFSKDPLYRRHHQDTLTFAMIYEYSERFVMPLSHDEVVHLKGSLLSKMPGDEWQKLANLRVLLGYQLARPGKSLLFMGTELAPWTEWNHDTSLDWHLLEDPSRAAFERYVAQLGALYQHCPPMWRNDPSWEGFGWIDVSDRDNSVLSFVRWDGLDDVVVVMNLTPVPRENYRIGAPSIGTYVELLNSDAGMWGGSGYPTKGRVDSEPAPFHGYPQSMTLTLPPLSLLVLARAEHAARWARE